MLNLKAYEIWFLTGSQPLYGSETLDQVAAHSREIVATLDDVMPVSIVFKPILTTPDEIYRICQEANASAQCVGVITWMHTFSPARNWISGLKALSKPFAHLHTQYNQAIPWDSIDMDFMNLNQSAHGDREFGFMASRMRLNRKVVVGHWRDSDVHDRLTIWARAVCAWADAQNMRVARFGDNMRSVAVTEGDKVEAQIRLGYQVYGFGVGDLSEQVRAVSDTDIAATLEAYESHYTLSDDLRKGGTHYDTVVEAARIEIGLRQFLQDGNFKAFTTTFEDLHGLKQLPGLAVQRLMAEGYGFGAEGDWKTSALLRAMKVMSLGLDNGGTSFMEDYTYHLDPSGQKVLGAHMLEVCPTIAAGKPKLEVHPLGIGGKSDPARLVFDVAAGPAINVSLVDMGNRFRLIVNDVDVVLAQPMPQLPVARALWVPQPNLKTSATAWIYAGGAHHTGFSQSLTAEYMADFADIAGIEYLRIDQTTDLQTFKNELRWNDVYYMLEQRY